MLPALSIINVGFLFVFGVFCLTFLSRYNKLKIVRLVRSNCPRLRITYCRFTNASKYILEALAISICFLHPKESVLRIEFAVDLP